MQVILNGSTYEIKQGSFITKQPLIEFPQHIRTTGQQERGGRSLMSNWWLDNFESGFGCEKMDISSARQKSSFWDSEVETSIRGQVVLPPKSQSASLGLAASYNPRWLYTYGGSLYGLGFGAATYYMSRYTATGWISDTTGTKVGSLTAKNIFYEGNTPHFITRKHATAYDYFYDFALVPQPTDSVFVGSIVGGDIGNLVSAWRCPVSRVWSLVGEQKIGIFAATGNVFRQEKEIPTNAVLNSMPFLGQDGYEGLFLFYPNKVTCIEDIQSLDATPAPAINEVPYIDLAGAEDSNNAKEVVIFNNNLVFPVQDALLAYATNGEVTDIGMNMFDGMPSDKQGKVVNLCSSMRNLYAGVLNAGKTSIFKFDGIGWHWVGRTASIGTIGSIYALSFLGSEAIWHGGGGIGTLAHFDYPFVNPMHKSGYKFATVGTITAPQFDGGLPNIKGVAFGMAIDGDFGIARTCDAYYGLDGGAPTFFIGTANTSGLNHFSIGAGLGATHTRFQPKFVLRGIATLSPTFRSAVLEYLKFPDTREVFSFTIDLVKTANANLTLVKALAEKLMGVRDTLNLVPFKYGDWATTNIKIMEMPGLEEIVTAVDSVYATAGMAALVTVRAIELGG